MTVIRHFTKGGENTCGVSLDGREYTAEIFVETDDPKDTGHAVIQYLIGQGFIYGRPYNFGNDNLSSTSHPIKTYLESISPPVLADGSMTMWSVTLNYKTVTPELNVVGGGSRAQTPFTRRPQVSTNTVTRQKAIYEAIYRGGLLRGDWNAGQKRLITNSADDIYFPPIEVEYQNRILRIIRNFSEVFVNDTNLPLEWINLTAATISDRKTTIQIQPFQLKLLNWSTEPAFEDGHDFVKVTFEGEITKKGWRIELLDEGINEKPNAGSTSQPPPKKKPIRSEGEGRIVNPVPLDGKGMELKIPPATIQDRKFSTWSHFDEIEIRSLAFFSGIVS